MLTRMNTGSGPGLGIALRNLAKANKTSLESVNNPSHEGIPTERKTSLKMDSWFKTIKHTGNYQSCMSPHETRRVQRTQAKDNNRMT